MRLKLKSKEWPASCQAAAEGCLLDDGKIMEEVYICVTQTEWTD
jgi:hypothetical protein